MPKNLTSIWGSLVGLRPDPSDSETRHLSLSKGGYAEPLTIETSATQGTTLSNYGVATLNCSAGSTGATWTLAQPTSGVEKQIFVSGPATNQVVSVESTSINIYTTSTSTSLQTLTSTSTAPGAFARLMGLSTASWLLVGSGNIAAS